MFHDGLKFGCLGGISPPLEKSLLFPEIFGLWLREWYCENQSKISRFLVVLLSSTDGILWVS